MNPPVDRRSFLALTATTTTAAVAALAASPSAGLPTRRLHHRPPGAPRSCCWASRAVRARARPPPWPSAPPSRPRPRSIRGFARSSSTWVDAGSARVVADAGFRRFRRDYAPSEGSGVRRVDPRIAEFLPVAQFALQGIHRTLHALARTARPWPTSRSARSPWRGIGTGARNSWSTDPHRHAELPHDPRGRRFPGDARRYALEPIRRRPGEGRGRTPIRPPARRPRGPHRPPPRALKVTGVIGVRG